MVNYENGKIYKIVCNETGFIYIGSIAQKYLSTRLGEHTRTHTSYLNGKSHYVTSCKFEKVEILIFCYQKFILVKIKMN